LPDDKLTIETPEQIPLDFPLAGIGSRFLAVAFDFLLQFVSVLGLMVIADMLFYTIGRFSSMGPIWVAAAAVLVFFLIQFGYFAIFESLWNGQTPGKRRLHLRVIKDSGQPITTYDAVARNLLRIVDSLPGLYVVGILSALLSSKSKRLGDYVAGTVVVHEKPLRDPGQIGLNFAGGESRTGYDLRRLSQEEFQLIEAYLLRRPQLSSEVRARLTRQIVERIALKLQISEDDQKSPDSLLEKLAAEYRNQARYR
jgi:uncharacterized RDD family membrane protein YckC